MLRTLFHSNLRRAIFISKFLPANANSSWLSTNLHVSRHISFLLNRSYASSSFDNDTSFRNYREPQQDISGFREPPGYVAPHRWLKPRPLLTAVEDQLFDMKQRTSVEEYMSNHLKASLSGAPIQNGFTYPVLDTLTDIPQLSSVVFENLQRMGLSSLTPVQRHAISILGFDEAIPIQTKDSSSFDRVVGQYDLMAAAQTGSGKTLAYLIPILNRLLRVYPYEAMQNNMDKPMCQHPVGLVLVPTRELVQQIRLVASQLCFRSFLRPVGIFGGEKPMRQQNAIAQGCHFVVATPGRLLDFLKQGLLSLENCRSLILDEADRMLDMGFEDQIRMILESPEFQMPQAEGSERQTCLFSATFPREVAVLARNFLRGDRCISLTLSDQQFGAVVPEWGKTAPKVGKMNELAQLGHIVPREITQEFQLIQDSSFNALYSHLLSVVEKIINNDSGSTDEVKRILIFCNTKAEVDRIERYLNGHRISCRAIHGDKPQSVRTMSLEHFRKGSVNVLVASSVAARGLDIPAVTAVINIGFPQAAEDYVHRIGRTGRMGRQGMAITLVTKSILEQSSSSTLKGIMHIVESSLGSLDGVPAEILQQADNRFEPAPRGRNAHPAFDQRKRRRF